MGNINSCTLSEAELGALTGKFSAFSGDEVKALWLHFQGISADGDGGEGISRSQFQSVLLFKDSAMIDRIFRVFDANEDGRISFEEYLQCLSVLSSKASQEDKLKLSFQIYDLDGDNMISVDDLTSALASTLREHDIIIERKEIDEIVTHTMDEVCPDVTGKISLSEYEDLVAQRPQMLSRLSLNISGIIKEYVGGIGAAS
jgi:Ca2+-binding EF-hand superfamily protein